MSDSSLPAGWVARESKSHPGKVYYSNTVTGESVWERPTAPATGSGSGSGSAEPTQVRASHILAKHRGSRRPSSWRTEVITMTKEDAIKEITAIRERIVRGEARFEDIARERSDCSSAAKGGDLGPFARGQMQAAFENAAFALKVGEMSGIVDSDSGIHIILRTA
jgi:NIMA-interacting peptidyl-prolyl cis-trans isomerase 1